MGLFHFVILNIRKMDPVKRMTYEEFAKIIENPETKLAFDNPVLAALSKGQTLELKDEFIMELPYDQYKVYMENLGHEILSQFTEDERKLLRWEHVGSTSIPGMPGTKLPDCLLIYDKYPPTKKIIEVLLNKSFHFWRVAKHLDENDLWFVRVITEEGFLKGCKMTLHLVDKTCYAAKRLIGMRDLCRSEKWAFEEYKALKLQAVNGAAGGNFMDYKMKKSAEIRSKLKDAIEEYMNKTEEK